jgi:crotonobetainyl-CoA:carnitine CoA-transferase CaiB-like acyl-CoA transferase
MTAFGQEGPRGNQTAYDHAIQSTSGITAATGTQESGPIKVGAPVIDYAVGTTGAFALSAALYQTLRTGKGQYIDMAMLDVALMLQATHITDYFHSGHTSKRAGNKMRFPESSMQEASDGLVQLAASNARQHERFYNAIGEPAEAQRRSLDDRYARYDEKQSMIARKMKGKTAQEWEDYLQSKHVPATRVRPLHETLQDPHLAHRGILHQHENVPGVGKVTVPLQAFKFAHDGASIERAPPRLGEHTDEILAAVGYTAADIAAMRKAGAAA